MFFFSVIPSLPFSLCHVCEVIWLADAQTSKPITLALVYNKDRKPVEYALSIASLFSSITLSLSHSLTWVCCGDLQSLHIREAHRTADALHASGLSSVHSGVRLEGLGVVPVIFFAPLFSRLAIQE